METSKAHAFERRYDRIDDLNKASFYMNDAFRPFDVMMSVHSAGKSRERIDKNGMSSEEAERLNSKNKAARFILGGNMSTVVLPDGKVPYGPTDMDDEGRLADARANMNRYFESIGVDPAQVRVLNPERDYSTPLTVVNADEDHGEYNGVQPVRLEKSGDFVYTFNPEIVLAVRPADCPIAVFTSETPDGRIYGMVHFAWRGPASGQFEDMARAFSQLGVDTDSLNVYVTPGGHAEDYQFARYVPDGKNNPKPVEGTLFTNVRTNDDGSYAFGIDTPYAVYKVFLDLGLKPEQLFLDTSDTNSLESGYGSHSRAMRQGEDNVRDLVTIQLHS